MIKYQIRKLQALKGLCLQFNNIPPERHIVPQGGLHEAEAVDIWGVRRTSG